MSAPAMMRSVYRSQYGGPEVLEVRDVPTPVPAPDEVLVRVHATTVSRTDCGGLWGAPFVYRFFCGLRRPRHVATGCDFAGEVAAVGRDVTTFREGDRVWGFDDNSAGTHAEYVAYPVRRAIRAMPAGLDYAHAVACAEGAHYALNFLRKVPIEPGRPVLVNGATGAIGSAVVQLLVHAGVQVTAVCATPQVELVRSLGPARVIDYLKEDFTAGDDRYDVVLDAVGKSTFGKCRRILNRRGRYVSSELGPHAQNIYLSMITPLLGGKSVRFPFPVNIDASLAQMTTLVEQGHFRPLIDRTYRLDEIRDAFTYVASGQKIGNVILQP